jgi:hypothetical protein
VSCRAPQLVCNNPANARAATSGGADLANRGYISSFELALEVASGRSEMPGEMIIAIGDEA